MRRRSKKYAQSRDSFEDNPVDIQGLLNVRTAKATVHKPFARYFCTISSARHQSLVLSLYQDLEMDKSSVDTAKLLPSAYTSSSTREGRLLKRYAIGECLPWNGKGWRNKYEWCFRLSVRRLFQRLDFSSVTEPFDKTLEITCRDIEERGNWVASISLGLRTLEYGPLPFNWEAVVNLRGGFFTPAPGGWKSKGLDEGCRLEGYVEPTRWAASQHVSTLICFTDHNTKTQTFNDPRLFPEVIHEPTDIFPQQVRRCCLLFVARSVTFAPSFLPLLLLVAESENIPTR
jgi:hypothetical protein